MQYPFVPVLAQQLGEKIEFQLPQDLRHVKWLSIRQRTAIRPTATPCDALGHGIVVAAAAGPDRAEYGPQHGRMGARGGRIHRVCRDANGTGQPAMSLPLGMSADGLPIGIMTTGRYGEEGLLFRLAEQVERAAPRIGRRPKAG
ncbi:hypothetical protein IP81_14990 [Novosphingobium sp. AAP83]|nr:hypothetical protein IP81_14990 [Novosphingobium sp. AAP83]